MDHYNPQVLDANDYYPFGSLEPGRTYAASIAGNYRYGFNGKENDNEVKGVGDQQDYGMRIYDPRVGRFLSIDPLTKKYPELTPYQFASNRPIDGIDLDGKEFSPAGYNNGNPRDQTAVQLYPDHPVIIQQRVDATQHAARLQVRPADVYGRGWIGPPAIVDAQVGAVNQEYYNAVADNIKGGPMERHGISCRR